MYAPAAALVRCDERPFLHLNVWQCSGRLFKLSFELYLISFECLFTMGESTASCVEAVPPKPIRGDFYGQQVQDTTNSAVAAPVDHTC